MLDLPHYFLYNDMICLSICFVMFSLDAFFILQSYRHCKKKSAKKSNFTSKSLSIIETHIIIGKNLLQIVIESAKKSNLTQEASDRFIIDNCKNIYLVGFETTAIVALLCLMLLASNKNWQDCACAEVLEICRGRIPNSDMLS